MHIKYSVLLFLLFVTDAASAQEKRRVKVQKAADSLSRHTVEKFYDSIGRKTSVRLKDYKDVTIITYTPTGKEKSREVNNGHLYHQIWIRYYDKNDNQINTVRYDLVDDSKDEVDSYTYDEKNRELTHSYYHPGGELEHRVYKSYDEKNNTDTTWWYSGSILQQSISKYDNDNKEIATEFHSGDDTVEYTTFLYDKENRLIEKKMRQGRYYENTSYQYYPNGDALKTHIDELTYYTGKVIEDWEYFNEYNTNGDRTRAITIWTKNGRLLEKTVMRYSYEYY